MRAQALAIVVVGALAGVSACTFPSVDYANSGGGGAINTGGGGAAGTGGNDAGPPPCDISMKCATDASSCGKKADAEAKACEKKCKPPDEDSCKEACSGARSADLAACGAACVTCVARPDCPKVEEECASLAEP